jgi:hypothetical protein
MRLGYVIRSDQDECHSFLITFAMILICSERRTTCARAGRLERTSRGGREIAALPVPLPVMVVVVLVVVGELLFSRVHDP